MDRPDNEQLDFELEHKRRNREALLRKNKNLDRMNELLKELKNAADNWKPEKPK